MVDQASDGKIGLQKFERNWKCDCKLSNCPQKYKMIFMDLGMPNMDGF